MRKSIHLMVQFLRVLVKYHHYLLVLWAGHNERPLWNVQVYGTDVRRFQGAAVPQSCCPWISCWLYCCKPSPVSYRRLWPHRHRTAAFSSFTCMMVWGDPRLMQIIAAQAVRNQLREALPHAHHPARVLIIHRLKWLTIGRCSPSMAYDTLDFLFKDESHLILY